MSGLSDDTQKEALLIAEKINHEITSNGNPAVLASYKAPPSISVFAIITFILLIVGYIIAEISNYYEIKRNWSAYRCSPTIAPFAQFYGYDLAETINFCVQQEVKTHAPAVIEPIYKGINAVTGVVDQVYNKVSTIESGIAGLLQGFQTFVVNFINSFRLLGTRVRMSFIRIKEIFGRVHALFLSFAYAGISAITFGENLICNPLVVFIGTIAGVDICCFAPDTRLAMADGTTATVSEIRIGDLLADGATVTSTYLFDGTQTRMRRLRGIHVSANHYVVGPEGVMCEAGDHPDSVDAPSLPRLWCLATSTNRLPVVTDAGSVLVFSDYEESSDPDVIAEAQAIALRFLNNLSPYEPVPPPIADYSLGLDPTLLVYMGTGTWKQLSQICVGDVLADGARVVGVIRERCNRQCLSPGGHYFSAAQLVYDGDEWVRAAYMWPAVDIEPSVLYHLMIHNNQRFIVSGNSELFAVRDYAEVTSMDIQKPYMKSLTS